MAQITYPWNPFQERVDCRIPAEQIKPSDDGVRREFVPRAAPFFSHNFVLRRAGSNDPLIHGVDYVFGHPFNRFITDLKRNCFGSVILLKPITAVVTATYDTIGGPFMLDEIAYAQLVANIVNSPRQAYWENLVGVPAEWPPLPHPHPAAQVYDFQDMLFVLRDMVLAMFQSGSDSQLTIKQMLDEHLQQAIPEAHAANKAALGLDLIANDRKATLDDLLGNSDNAMVSVKTLKEALRRMAASTLDLN